MDIVIYTNPAKLRHKRGLPPDEPGAFYWRTTRLPRRLKAGDRVYFATEGKVQGSFEVGDVEDYPDSAGEERDFSWHSDSWRRMRTEVPARPFRSFRYRWWGRGAA